MIKYKEIDKNYLEVYDQVPMLVHVKEEYSLEKIDNGLGGIVLKEIPVDEYVKDLGAYEKATEYEKRFDISNWAFFMAFDNEKPIGAVTVASQTEGVHMIGGRQDLSILWDIRVADGYKGQGVGQNLFDLAVNWSREKGLKQMKIECQNNNVPACKFYHKQGAVLGKIDEYAYYEELECQHEVQLIWYLNL